jgi:hypothetical protein
MPPARSVTGRCRARTNAKEGHLSPTGVSTASSSECHAQVSSGGPLRDRVPEQPDHEHLTKRPHVYWTAKEMQVLSEQELRSQLQQTREAEARADTPGMERSAKGRGLWRRNRELVEEEMGRRHLS